MMAQITDDSDPWGGAWKRYAVDLNRQVLNPEGFDNGDGEPSILSLPDGRVIVAWANSDEHDESAPDRPDSLLIHAHLGARDALQQRPHRGRDSAGSPEESRHASARRP